MYPAYCLLCALLRFLHFPLKIFSNIGKYAIGGGHWTNMAVETNLTYYLMQPIKTKTVYTSTKRIIEMEANLQTDEAQILVRAQQGDDEAFSYLVETYHRQVYNLCYRMLGNPNDAEDAAQEAFIRAYKNIHRYDLGRKFSTWLLTIANNYCIDQHRKRKLDTFSYDALPVPDLEDRKPSLEQNFVGEEKEQEAFALLDHLKPKDRSAVILRYWYEYSYEEIAETLSLSVSAVKSRLHRARRDLAVEWLDANAEIRQTERTPYESTV